MQRGGYKENLPIRFESAYKNTITNANEHTNKPGFDYQTERGAAAVRVRFRRGWRPSSGSESGSGSGSGPACWREAADYCNGGPFFVAPNGAADWGYDSDGGGGSGGALEGVEVLARYVGLPPGAVARVTPAGSDGSGGGDGGDDFGGAAAATATATATTTAVAAVRCRVGAGAAVLCGTHPELGPRWLDACGLTPPRPGSGDDGSNGSRGPVGNGEAPDPRALATAAAEAGGAAGSPDAAAAIIECPDAELACHTAALRAALEPHQEARDALLATLLEAALAHQHEAEAMGPLSGGGGALGTRAAAR